MPEKIASPLKPRKNFHQKIAIQRKVKILSSMEIKKVTYDTRK
jgi:hypothetical protein